MMTQELGRPGSRDNGYKRSLIHNIYGRETLSQDTKIETSSFSS